MLQVVPLVDIARAQILYRCTQLLLRHSRAVLRVLCKLFAENSKRELDLFVLVLNEFCCSFDIFALASVDLQEIEARERKRENRNSLTFTRAETTIIKQQQNAVCKLHRTRVHLEIHAAHRISREIRYSLNSRLARAVFSVYHPSPIYLLANFNSFLSRFSIHNGDLNCFEQFCTQSWLNMILQQTWA